MEKTKFPSAEGWTAKRDGVVSCWKELTSERKTQGTTGVSPVGSPEAVVNHLIGTPKVSQASRLPCRSELNIRQMSSQKAPSPF